MKRTRKRTRRIVTVFICFMLVFSLIPSVFASAPEGGGTDDGGTTTSEIPERFIRIGLKFGSNALASVTTGSDAGGDIGVVVAFDAYTPITTFSPSDVITLRPDSAYHIYLTAALTDAASAQTAMAEISLLLESSAITPFYAFDGSSWYVAAASYNVSPAAGVNDVSGVDSFSLLQTLLEGSAYSLSVCSASASAIMCSVNDSPVFMLNVAVSNIKLRVTPSPENVLPLMKLSLARYRGSFEFGRVGTGNINVVNYVEIEDYLRSVVPSEMVPGSPSTYERRIEGLKTQAVLARTAAYKWSAQSLSTYGYNADPTTNYQTYSGYTRENGSSGEAANTNAAIEQTRGMCAMYNGRLANDIFYSSNNGGYIETPENVWYGYGDAYLVSKPDPWNSSLKWSLTHTGASLSAKLASYILSSRHVDIGYVRYVNVVSRSSSGRVIELMVEGTLNDAVLTRQTARTALSARSQLFTFSVGDVVSIIEQQNGDKKELSARARKYLEGIEYPVSFLSDSYAVRGSDGYLYERVRVYSPSDTSTIIISGDGWGHGIGMSQDGAEAMSYAGKTYLEIIEFYFPGITVDVPTA